MDLTKRLPVAPPLTDPVLTTRVRGALNTDPAIQRCAIEVRASDGTVTLRGQVPGGEAALRAQQLALAVGGVEMVWTDLKWNDDGSGI